jgi:hypothetical protein
MFDQNSRFQTFRDALDARGVTLRALWETRRDGKPAKWPKRPYDVAFCSVHADKQTRIGTLIIIDYGADNGFGVYADISEASGGRHTIEADIAIIAAPSTFGAFNCCVGGNEPDWSVYRSLFVGGCVDQSDKPDETQTVGGQSARDAQFFTVYGRTHDGLLDAITDAATARDVLTVAGELARRSRLPVELDPAL